MPVFVPCKSQKEPNKKWRTKRGDTIFPIISKWLLAAKITTVLARYATKPDAGFPLLNDATHET